MPLAYCTQTTVFTHSKTHASPTRTPPTRRWAMLLMSELADMICQVLAAGTWGSRDHRRGLCSRHGQAHLIHAGYTHSSDMHTHLTGIRLRRVCASERPPECSPVKGTIHTAFAAQLIQVWKQRRSQTRHTWVIFSTRSRPAWIWSQLVKSWEAIADITCCQGRD